MKDQMIHLVYSEENYIDPPFAIFDDRSEALRFTERFKETRAYTVVRRMLNPPYHIPPDLKPLGVAFAGNGAVTVYPLSEETEDIEWALAGDYNIHNHLNELICYVLAANEPEALIKASKLRDELIVEGLWDYRKGHMQTPLSAKRSRQPKEVLDTEGHLTEAESQLKNGNIYLVYAEENYIETPLAIFDDETKVLRFTEHFKDVRQYITVKQQLNPTYHNELDRIPFGVSFEKNGRTEIYLLDEDTANAERATAEDYHISRDTKDLHCYLMATDEMDALTHALKTRDKLIAKGMWAYDPDRK